MKIRLISIAAVVILGLIAAVTVISGYAQIEREYNACLAKARAHAEKQVPYNAYNQYKAAFKIRCDDEQVYKEFLVQAELLGGTYYASAVEAYVEHFPESANAYELLCQLQYTRGSYKEVITLALQAREKGLATEKVREMYLECSNMLVTIKAGLDEAQSFLGGYARVKEDGLYGYITAGGKYLLAPSYTDATAMMGSNAAVFENDEWHMINSTGHTVARANKAVDSMGFLSGGKICISAGGKYGYMTSAMVVPETLPYDYASTFRSGVAAVKVGDQWALINTNEEKITDFIFEDILLDEFDSCYAGGAIFVKKDGKYYMVNAEGKKISEQGFDDAQPFVGKQPAAVCVDGKWGFVDTAGNWVIEPQYEAAKSFSLSLGAVCIDGLWGYVNTSGEIRVPCQFTDCMPFASNGIAAVKDGNAWKYVQLLAYEV